MPYCDDRLRGHTDRGRRRRRPPSRRLPRPHHRGPPSRSPGWARVGDRRGCRGRPPIDRFTVPRPVDSRRSSTARGTGGRPRRSRRARVRRRRRHDGRRRRLPPQPRRARRRGPARPPEVRALAAGAQVLAVRRASTTTRTSAACSATPRPWASTGCCSDRAARIRCTGAASGSRWGTCCGCRSPSCREVAELTGRAAGGRAARGGADPAPDALPLAAAGLAGVRTALLLGAEGPGLTPEALAAADLRVRIPMATGVDSLNVATAAAVAFHEVTRSVR